MSERDEHNELIHRLAEGLRNHTEPYKEGAWERFAATYGKRRRPVWPYWSAAAVVLAAIGLYWGVWQSGSPAGPSAVEPQVVQEHMTVPDKMGSETATAAVPEHDTAGPQLPDPGPSLVAGRQSVGGDRRIEAILLPGDAAVAAVHTADTASDATTPAAAVITQQLATVAAAQEVDDQPDANDASSPVPMPAQPAVERDAYAVAPTVQDMERWDLGVMVAPSLTSEKVNLGGGLTVAYRISDKFSIGSGISIAQLGVGENPDYQPGFNSRPSGFPSDASVGPPGGKPVFSGELDATTNYRTEVSTTSSVVTLDIPLDLRYEVAKGFYTSIGVSYVTVLNEQRTSHFVDKINANTFTNGHSGSGDRLSYTEFTYSSEKIAAKPLRGNGYAGFMNFSVGKKLPISSKLFLSVEPYFKLPIGRLSKEEMDFTNGGIRIVTGF